MIYQLLVLCSLLGISLRTTKESKLGLNLQRKLSRKASTKVHVCRGGSRNVLGLADPPGDVSIQFGDIVQRIARN